MQLELDFAEERRFRPLFVLVNLSSLLQDM